MGSISRAGQCSRGHLDREQPMPGDLHLTLVCNSSPHRTKCETDVCLSGISEQSDTEEDIALIEEYVK